MYGLYIKAQRYSYSFLNYNGNHNVMVSFSIYFFSFLRNETLLFKFLTAFATKKEVFTQATPISTPL